MAEIRLGLMMHGVTGRMGLNQHLIRSIVAIRQQGGVALENGDRVMPDPILLGRNAEALERIAKAHGIARWSTDVDAALANPADTVFFDAATTNGRARLLERAMRAGKHVYCEKPVAPGLEDALGLVRLARQCGVKHGVVQDKLFLPGLLKLAMLVKSGFFGRILSVRGEFGYWVFEGDLQPIQRPSWNYRSAEGGGIILDMMCHWRYVLDNLFGAVKSRVVPGRQPHSQALGRERPAVHGRRRRRLLRHAAAGRRHRRAHQQLVVHARPTRRSRHLPCRRHPRVGGRGPHGLQESGAREHAAARLESRPAPADEFLRAMAGRPDTRVAENGFKVQWEQYIRHVVAGAPFQWDLLEGAKGVQLVECSLQSWRERRWIDVPGLGV